MLRQFLLGGDGERGREREAQSPGSASSLSSSASSNDSYLAEDLFTPRQYQSPAQSAGYLPSFLPAPPALPSGSSSSSSSPSLTRLSRSTSAPFSPSLSAHVESPMQPPYRRMGEAPPPSSSPSSSSSPSPRPPPQIRHAHHRPHLSLHVEVHAPASSAVSAVPSLSPAPDELSQQVELSPMQRRVVKARAMSAGSPILYRSLSPQLEDQKVGRTGLVRQLSAPAASGAADGVSYFPRAYSDGGAREQQEADSASEAASPMPLLPSVSRQPSSSIGDTFRSMSAASSSARRSLPTSKSCRSRAAVWGRASLRCLFLSLMFTALFSLAFLILVEFRTVTLYNNVVCRPSTSVPIADYAPAAPSASASVAVPAASSSSSLFSSSSPVPNSSSPSNPPSPAVTRTQTTVWHGKVYVVFWNLFASCWGILSFLRYTSSALLSTLSPRIRVPGAFTSSAPAFLPNYSLAPRLLSLPINHFRYAGSHNSYHMQSSYPIPAFAYSHASLPAQLGDYTDGVRQLELDLHFLPGSGGAVVYHVQLVDDHINCYCLEECLLLVRDWSAAHPLHFPIMLMLEVKRQAYEDMSLGLNGITCNDLYNMDVALTAVFPPGTFLLPRDVRGDFPSVFAALSYQAYMDRKTNRWNNSDPSRLPSAEEEERMRPLHQYASANSSSYGWPSLGSMLGRFLLVWLDDVYNYADRLPCVRDDPSSQHSILFIAQAVWNKTYSAIHISRDPLLDAELIARALEHGLILRALTTIASFRRRSSARYEKALQLGVHCLASDFEQPCAGNVRTRNSSRVDNTSVVVWQDVSRYGTWCERTATGWPFECNPSMSASWCVDELNAVRVEGLRRADNHSSTTQ